MIPKFSAMYKIIAIALLFFSVNSYSQSLKLSDLNERVNTPQSTEEVELFKPIMYAWPLNPMLVVEGGNVYFGLTKEVSLVLAKIRVKTGVEYSYIFRGERNNHLRAFADYLIPLQTGDFAAVLINVGSGYFSDTKKSGIFPQVSLSILAPFGDIAGVNLYLKARETFMFQKEEANIFDLSLGIGLSLYPF